MYINWKVIAFFGGIGFLISLLAGIIGGVGFGTILWRSILGATGFGALGLGIIYLIQKYLPELTGDAESEETGPEGIDIVIEDDTMPEGERKDLNTGLGNEGDSPSADSSEDESAEDSDFVEEVEETVGEPSQEQDHNLREESGDEDTKEFVPTDIATDVDTLPDIGELSGTFEGIDTGESTDYDEQDKGRRGGNTRTVDMMGEEKDPQEIAKAVQTIMKKE